MGRPMQSQLPSPADSRQVARVPPSLQPQPQPPGCLDTQVQAPEVSVWSPAAVLARGDPPCRQLPLEVGDRFPAIRVNTISKSETGTQSSRLFITSPADGILRKDRGAKLREKIQLLYLESSKEGDTTYSRKRWEDVGRRASRQKNNNKIV